MYKKSKFIDINLILLIIVIFIEVIFFLFNYSKGTMENYICLFFIFITILVSYFVSRVYSLIFSAFIIFIYSTYILHQSLNYGYHNSPSPYFFILSIPIISFITNNLAYEINNIQHINENFQKKYKELVTIDEITGFNNIKSFYSDLDKEISKAVRHEFPLTLMMIKIMYYDNLTKIIGKDNIRRLISEVGKSINESTRNEDEIYRSGKDVFSFLLTNTDISGADIVKNRIKKEIDTLALTDDAYKNVSIDLKIGIYEYDKSKIKNIYDFVGEAEEEMEYDF
ncbi:GGDEF domain-containing protein [Clostridium oceanicum]|uniref:Diguanylate cyclase n=1 Tax=Clostridium oceanicum TaxID=1543 RepID=A0ABN1JR85_9CLOT